MHLADLYKKQDEDLETFNRVRQKVWDDLKAKHNSIISAFQSIDNLPDDQARKIEKELDDYNRKWSPETGIKYKDMIAQHKQQIQHITGKKPTNDNKPKTPTDRKRSEFIATMKAIQKRNQQQKPKQ